jgi:WD40 repeat protein
VTGVAFSPDGTRLATASSDQTARIWGGANRRIRVFRKPQVTMTGHAGPVNGMAFSPDGARLATASSDQTARIWDTATGHHRTTMTGHTGRVSGVAFSPDGTRLATASGDSTARIWDTATGQPRTTMTGHTGLVNGVAFSPDGTRLATASSDRTTRIWDTATGGCLAILLSLPEEGYAVLLPDGAYKIAGDPRGIVWWAIKLCRFEAGELDRYVPEIRRLADDDPLTLPARGGRHEAADGGPRTVRP